MGGFLLRRVAFAVVLVAVASSAALVLTRLAPGDVATDLGPGAKPEEIRRIQARFDLDRPIGQQWALWAGRALRLDLGDSHLYNQPVRGLVARAAVNTSVLALTALVTATFVGVLLGVATGRPGTSRWREVLRAASLLCVSVPPLVTSLLLVLAAARTGWFPVGGMSSISASTMSWGAWLVDLAWHLCVPTVALALPIAATFERLQSQALAEVGAQPYLVAAAARGVSEDAVLWRHAWPASLRPICAVFGVAVGALLSGSFVVEHVTAWPGLGRLMFEALKARDIYLVAGCAATGSFFLAIGTLVGDVLLAYVDPRVTEARA
ncbi:MAG TPA: ABC transporter permease [Vicinamibacterales bacterium]